MMQVPRSKIGSAGGGLRRSDPRQRVETAADRLLEGLLPWRSIGGARFDLPGPRHSENGSAVDGLEGFARSFLLAAFRMRHASAERRDRLADRYAEGLTAARKQEPWPRIDGASQPFVEAAATSLALLLTTDDVWARLDQRTRDGVLQYLLAARSVSEPVSNWAWFRILIECFLERAGVGADTDAIDARLDVILGLRRPGGMWSDGSGSRFDHYGSWAFSFYSAFWAQFDGDRRPDVEAVLRDHAIAQRRNVAALIDDRGVPVLQGRSLIYRAAATAGLWTPALFPDCAPDPGSGWIGRVTADSIDWFISHGALHDEVLTLGWLGEYLPITQHYSGPGSAYWMSKAFSGLLLPPQHPSWEPAGSDSAASRPTTLPAAGWLVQRSAGLVRVHNHGTARTLDQRDPHSRRFLDDPLYSRLAYSSTTAPVLDQVERDSTKQPALPDNALVLEDSTGDRAFMRDEVVLGRIEPNLATSTWTLRSRRHVSTPVTSCTLVHHDDEVRLHQISLHADTVVVQTGYAVSGEAIDSDEAGSEASVVSNGVHSSIRALTSSDAAIELVPAGPFGSLGALPLIRTALPSGEHVIGAAFHLGFQRHEGVWPVLRLGVAEVTVTWPDGDVTTIELPAACRPDASLPKG